MVPRLASSLLVSLCLAASLSAQKLDVPAKIAAGDQIKITYSNPAKANGVVIVEVRDNDVSGSEFLEIHLDANGFGSVEWLVPQWNYAYFNAPDAKEQSRAID
jgi:hypothetical protein